MKKKLHLFWMSLFYTGTPLVLLVLYTTLPQPLAVLVLYPTVSGRLVLLDLTYCTRTISTADFIRTLPQPLGLLVSNPTRTSNTASFLY